MDSTLDRNANVGSLRLNSWHLVGKPFLIIIPHAVRVRSDLTLHAVSNIFIGNASDTIDSGYHCLIENCKIKPIQS